MSSKIFLRSTMEMVTPQVAKNLRAACHYERQRGLSQLHIERLADEMTRGSFIAGTQIFIGVLPDRKMLILNGNHTLEAIILSSVPLALTFTYCPVKDADEAGRIYAQFDIHRGRSWGDAYKAYGFTESLNPDWATKIGAAVGIIAQRFENQRDSTSKSRDVRAEIMRQYAKTSGLLLEAFSGANVGTLRFIKRRAVLAVALETMRYQPSAAAEFWGDLVRDDGLRIGNPRKALLSYLRNNVAETNTAQTQSKAAALAWNAFFRNDTLQYVKPNAMLGFRLDGTPWMRGDYDPLSDMTVVKSFSPSIPVEAAAKHSFTTGVTTTNDGQELPVMLFAA